MKTACLRGSREARARVSITELRYFDHNAATPLAPEVAETFAAATRDIFGNASSIHRAGQFARESLESSRRTIAGFIHASPSEIVFTSGGTESNNLAILGLVRNLSSSGAHVITTAIEHPSVLEPFRQLAREGVEVTCVPVGASGIVDVDTIRRSLRDDTVLVSVMHANNEIGTIQPIAEIAALLHARRAAGQKVYFHSDGIQALGKVDVDVQALHADLYSISAHKIFGPKGVGALFVRKGTPLRGIQHGGRHERERRPGTENVPAAVAFARAVELCTTAAADSVAEMRDRFEARVLSALDDVEINGAPGARLPNTGNLLFHGIAGEAMVIALDLKGMAVSTGSACSSGSIEPSPVLLAIGRTREEAKSSLRFSFSRYNTLEDADALADAVIASARQLRRHARQEPQLARA
ncbi:MAG TPA: cysteine desulfurase family protein [Bryobacteraceae bacterium]|nr:cysteine desulfurase family protein [Bryobacteraceae bacterium]